MRTDLYYITHALLAHRKVLYEVAKNLALAGVGKLSIVGSESMTSDLRSYNTHIDVGLHCLSCHPSPLTRSMQVQNVQSISCALSKCDVAVCAGVSFAEMISINAHCRRRGVQCVGATLHGVCGLVATDFGPYTELIIDESRSRSDEVVIN